MKTNFLRIAFGCALALLACIPIAHGQTVTGSITGEVTDPSGAVVAGAQVVAHNRQSRMARACFTSSFCPSANTRCR